MRSIICILRAVELIHHRKDQMVCYWKELKIDNVEVKIIMFVIKPN